MYPEVAADLRPVVLKSVSGNVNQSVARILYLIKGLKETTH